MKSWIVDTNVFLRLFLNDISEQADEAERLIKQAKVGKVSLIVPQIVIFEIEFALSKYYKFPKEKIVDCLTSIVSSEHLAVGGREVFSRAVVIYKGSNLSLTDCFLVAKSQMVGADVFTFDKALKKLAGKRV